MSLMLAETYKAFLEAGATGEQASKAASELAGYDSQLAGLETDVTLIKWMVGFNLALTTAILFKLFA